MNHDLDRAIAEAKKALAESPDSPELTVALAMLYGEKSDTTQARQLLHGLLKGNDDDLEVYLDIAQVEARGKKFADAEQSAAKAESMAHQTAAKESVWYMLGSIYDREKKYDEAEQQFRKVLEVDSDNAMVLNYFGYTMVDRGVRVDEATTMIQRALKQDPTNGAFLDSLGWAYYRQNKLVEAEEYIQKALDHEGDDPTILGHMADIQLKLGQNERAAEYFERSLSQWQKASPADYEPDRVAAAETQLKTLKKRLAQKSSPDSIKPQ
jgi:Tfp pilus assembly protein PilF